MLLNRWFRPVSFIAVMLCAWSAQGDGGEREALFVIGQSGRVARGEERESAIVIGGNLDVEGKVRGLAAAVGGDLRVGPTAVIGGPAASIGGELSVDAAARVHGPKVHAAGGDFSQVADELSATQKSQPLPVWAASGVRVLQVLAAFVLGLFLILWAPESLRTVRDEVQDAPARDLLLGLSLLLGIVPLCLLLALSIVGIVLIPAVLLLALVCFAYGLVAVGAQIGRRLSVSGGDGAMFRTVALGMLALAAGAALPFLGAFILFAAAIYGAGGVLATRFGTQPPGRRPAVEKSVPPSAAGTPISGVP